MLLAVFYAMLAGLSIPTQRALLMVIVALVLLASQCYPQVLVNTACLTREQTQDHKIKDVNRP